MKRESFIEILKSNPRYAHKFNNSLRRVVFPSSFGVVPVSHHWMFYEMDERLKETRKLFLDEQEAYDYVIKRYNLQQTGRRIRPVSTVSSIRAIRRSSANYHIASKTISKRIQENSQRIYKFKGKVKK